MLLGEKAFFWPQFLHLYPVTLQEVAVTIGVRLRTHLLNNRCFWQCCGRWHNFALAFGGRGLSALPCITCAGQT